MVWRETGFYPSLCETFPPAPSAASRLPACPLPAPIPRRRPMPTALVPEGRRPDYEPANPDVGGGVKK